MAGLQITITDAGRAALPNGPNTGTSAVTISHIGVSAVHTAGSLKGLTALPGEVKRVSTFGGDIVADDVIHITINDETTDVYSVRSFGLYLSTGVLFAVFSSPDVVVEKSAGAMVLLSADITFKTLDTAVIQFGGTGFINPPATTERLGVVELATWDESAAGNRADVAVTPFGLLKTLQSWATNFAAALHLHHITDVNGLAAALAGKAPLVHGHTLYNVDGLVEALASKASALHSHTIAQISGLAAALEAKAAAIHGHTLSNVDGLIEALNAKAAAIHGHSLFNVDGLVEALNSKSAIGHKHDASDTNSGVFDAGRIPALAMEKITGLASALAGKASLLANVVFGDVRASRGGQTGVLYFGDGDDYLLLTQGVLATNRPFNATTVSSGGNPTWHSGNFNPAAKAGLNETVTFADVRSFRGNGTGAIYLGDLSHYLFWDGVNYNLPSAPLIVNGGFVWTSATFDPATKATLGDNVTFGWIKSTSSIFYFGAGNTDYLQRANGAWFLGGGGPLYVDGAQAWTTATLYPATQAEAADPSVINRFVSPAALWSFARNLSSPGYAVIPGTGLMLQWGITGGSIPEGETFAVLPVAFGGGCLIALANPRNPGRNINSDFYMQVVGHFADRIAFFANRANGSAGNVDGFEWIALGRVSGGTPDPAYSSGGSGGGGGGGGGGGDGPEIQV